MLGGTEKNCKSPDRIECLGLPFETRRTDWLMRTAVTLTVLVQEMTFCQLFITSAKVLQLEIVCWNSVVSCMCELFLLFSVVACCAQIQRQASYTHTHTHTHTNTTPCTRRPVGRDRCSDVFRGAFLCKVSMVVQAVICAVKAQALLVSGWQSANSFRLSLWYQFISFILSCLSVTRNLPTAWWWLCSQPRHIMTASSGAEGACRNVRISISMFLIYAGCINTCIIPESKKKHFPR
jgi:hypothetical protein